MNTTTNPTYTEGEAPAERKGASNHQRHPLRESAIYLGIAYPIAIGIALALPGTRAEAGPASFISVFVPAIVVGLIRLTAKVRHQPANPHPLGLRRAGLRSWPAAFLLPAGMMAVSLGLTYALGIVRFEGLGPFLLDVPVSIAMMSVILLGEEIGWRSYLLPRLAAVMPARRASLVTGFCQGLFHMPLVLLTVAYDADGSRMFIAPSVVLCLTAAGAVFGWLRVRSGSLWPVAIAHATVNTFIIEAPTLVTDQPDAAAYLTGEAGIFTLLIAIGAAVFVLRRCNWTPRNPSKTTSERSTGRGPSEGGSPRFGLLPPVAP